MNAKRLLYDQHFSAGAFKARVYTERDGFVHIVTDDYDGVVLMSPDLARLVYAALAEAIYAADPEVKPPPPRPKNPIPRDPGYRFGEGDSWFGWFKHLRAKGAK